MTRSAQQKARSRQARSQQPVGATIKPPAGARTAPAPSATAGPVSVARGWRAAWSGGTAVGAVVLLLAQLVWRASYLVQGYFTQDDFLMLHLGGTQALAPGYLMQAYSGHLFPGGFLIAYVQARLAGLSWPAAYLPVIVMQLAAGVLMWLLLTRLLGLRTTRLPLLAVFCLCPLSLWSTQWWAVAIQFLPVELCGLAAALAYVAWRQDATRWGRQLTVAFVVVGLGFQERAMLILLVVLAAALVADRSGGVTGRVLDVVRRDARTWLALVGVVVLYLVLHAWLAPVTAGGGAGGRGSLDLVGNFFFRNLVPGLFGGPWTGERVTGAAVIPPVWVVAVSCGLLLALVGFTLHSGGATARLSWLLLLAYGAADVLLLFGGRAQYGGSLGLTTRYVADMMPILVIALAGALEAVVLPARLARFFAAAGRVERRTLAAVVVVVAYAASAAVTSRLTAPDLFNTAARSYVDNLGADLSEQPTAVLYDSTVPAEVMIPWFGKDSRVSTVYGIEPGAPQFDVASEQLRMVDDAGHVRQIVLRHPVSAVAGPSRECGYNVTLSPTLVPMPRQVPFGKNVLRLGYYTNVYDIAILIAGSQIVSVPVQPGLHSVDVVLPTTFDTFSVRLSVSAGTLCLASAVAGEPRPAQP